MGWFAFALAVALAGFVFWRIWRELGEIVAAVTDEQVPRTFVVGGSTRVRGIALALEKLSARQRELLARAQEGEFNVQTIMGALPDGLLVVDGTRQIRVVNDAFRRLFGVEGEVASFLETIRDAALEQLLGDALTKSETQQADLIRGDRHLEVIAEPLRSGNGGSRGAVVLFRDVTEVKRTEELRRDFVANVSHELRTPLSILRGYLETLLESPNQPPAELLRIFEVMERHSNRLNLLVEDVLSLARLEAPGAPLSLTNIKLDIFLRGIMRDWEKKFASKNLQVEVDAPEALPPLLADEGRLQEIVYNLLDNATKYSAPGGRVVVRAVSDEKEIELSVSDVGAGIPARDLPRIFERFYRADKARQRELGGTGLGLSIVKHIAQLHGGRVRAESTLGRGTTIRVTFPRRRAP
jgi:two-component system phosphate regulon sensor histidine kinase PhoR